MPAIGEERVGGVSAQAALLGLTDIRALAAELGLRPTKRLGQNFVHDANTVRRIVAASGVRSDDIVVEVGPGLGSLTLALLPAVSRVLAIEIDPLLAERLPRTVAERAPEVADRLCVLRADALQSRVDQVRALVGEPTALVANLPYNVAVPVLLHLFAELPSLAHGLVMVQAEVADRIAAGPGSRTYGVPSVKAAWFADVRRAGAVPRTVFWPVPHVDSALVSFTRRPPPASVRREVVFSLVDAAFAQRRKTLRSALAGWAGSPAAASRLLADAGLPDTIRGERLTVRDFARLAERAGA